MYLLHGGQILGALEVIFSVTVGILVGVLRSVWHFGAAGFAKDELGVVKERVNIDLARSLASSVDEHIAGSNSVIGKTVMVATKKEGSLVANRIDAQDSD